MLTGRQLSEICMLSLVLGPIFMGLFGVSISCLFLGFTKYSECPFEPLITQGFLVFGLVASICSIGALIFVSTNSFYDQKRCPEEKEACIFRIVLIIYQFSR
jgi:uncharacterized membrane protein